MLQCVHVLLFVQILDSAPAMLAETCWSSRAMTFTTEINRARNVCYGSVPCGQKHHFIYKQGRCFDMSALPLLLRPSTPLEDGTR